MPLSTGYLGIKYYLSGKFADLMRGNAFNLQVNCFLELNVIVLHASFSSELIPPSVSLSLPLSPGSVLPSSDDDS